MSLFTNSFTDWVKKKF